MKIKIRGFVARGRREQCNLHHYLKSNKLFLSERAEKIKKLFELLVYGSNATNILLNFSMKMKTMSVQHGARFNYVSTQ